MTNTTTINWTLTAERSPKFANFYLIVVLHSTTAIIGYWNGSKWTTEGEYGTEPITPTHWAETPCIISLRSSEPQAAYPF